MPFLETTLNWWKMQYIKALTSNLKLVKVRKLFQFALLINSRFESAKTNIDLEISVRTIPETLKLVASTSESGIRFNNMIVDLMINVDLKIPVTTIIEMLKLGGACISESGMIVQ
jgi:site-specific recombinase XerD